MFNDNEGKKAHKRTDEFLTKFEALRKQYSMDTLLLVARCKDGEHIPNKS